MKRHYYIIVLAFFLSQNGMGNTDIKKQENNINSKAILVLEKALDLIIKENKTYIYQHKKQTNGKCHLILNVNEVSVHADFKCFTLYFSDTELSDSMRPSYLIKKKGLYCAIYFKKGDTLLKRKIPDFLLAECKDSYGNEDSWMVLMCKSSFRYIVINNGLVPYKAIKQFQNFSCDGVVDKSTHPKIEEGIIDHVVMDSIIDNW